MKHDFLIIVNIREIIQQPPLFSSCSILFWSMTKWTPPPMSCWVSSWVSRNRRRHDNGASTMKRLESNLHKPDGYPHLYVITNLGQTTNPSNDPEIIHIISHTLLFTLLLERVFRHFVRNSFFKTNKSMKIISYDPQKYETG